MSSLDRFGNRYSGLNLTVLEIGRQKALSPVRLAFEAGIAHARVGDTTEEFWWWYESEPVHL